MTKVIVGSRIRDNDPRQGGREVIVVAIKGDFAEYHSGQRPIHIRLDRIHTDGKPRHQGWSLVSSPEETITGFNEDNDVA